MSTCSFGGEKNPVGVDFIQVVINIITRALPWDDWASSGVDRVTYQHPVMFLHEFPVHRVEHEHGLVRVSITCEDELSKTCSILG